MLTFWIEISDTQSIIVWVLKYSISDKKLTCLHISVCSPGDIKLVVRGNLNGNENHGNANGDGNFGFGPNGNGNGNNNYGGNNGNGNGNGNGNYRVTSRGMDIRSVLYS